jgi:hypothetical protein
VSAKRGFYLLDLLDVPVTGEAGAVHVRGGVVSGGADDG